MERKSIWNNYLSLSQHQWNAISGKETIKLINKFSEEQFSLIQIAPRTQALYDSYRERSVYPIPGTPKIIMPDYQLIHTHIQFFIQSESRSLSDLIKRLPSIFTILQKLKSAIRIGQMLTKKYGPFRIIPTMLKSTANESIIVWIDEQAECQARKYPIITKDKVQATIIMLIDFIMIFEKYHSSPLFENLKKIIQAEKFLTFQKAIKIIDKTINEQGLQFRINSPQKPVIPNFLLRNKPSLQNAQKNKEKHEKQSMTPKSANLIQTKDLKKVQSQTNFSVPSLKTVTPLKSQNIPITSFSPKNFPRKRSQSKHISSHQNQQDSHNPVKPFPNSMFIQKNSQMVQQDKKKIPYKSMNNFVQGNKKTSDVMVSIQKLPKKNFRDSSKSLATTKIYHSITSSGRTRLLQDEGPFQKHISTSFGSLKSPRQANNKRFKVKVSKIIEQKNCEDGNPNSPDSYENSEIINNIDSNLHKSQYRLCESEIERDFYDLLFHESKKDQVGELKLSNQLDLQQEIKGILY